MNPKCIEYGIILKLCVLNSILHHDEVVHPLYYCDEKPHSDGDVCISLLQQYIRCIFQFPCAPSCVIGQIHQSTLNKSICPNVLHNRVMRRTLITGVIDGLICL